MLVFLWLLSYTGWSESKWFHLQNDESHLCNIDDSESLSLFLSLWVVWWRQGVLSSYMISVRAFKNVSYVWHFGSFEWWWYSWLASHFICCLFSMNQSISWWWICRRSLYCLFKEVIDVSHLDVFSIRFSILNKRWLFGSIFSVFSP